MPYDVRAVNVMIASPSDVPGEVQSLIAALHHWNSQHSEYVKVVLLPIRWETHSHPEIGARPQAIVNKQVLSKADILVAVFWTRIGTPTGAERSGTVEEVLEHIKAEKPVLLYFSHKPVDPDSVEPEQYAQVKKFRSEMEESGLVSYFDSVESLVAMFKDHIHKKALNFRPHGENTPEAEMAAEPTTLKSPPIEGDALLLLKMAAASDGTIFHIRTLGGEWLQAGGQALGDENGSRREAARWKAALDQLIAFGLAEATSYKGEVFEITHYGYQIAELYE